MPHFFTLAQAERLLPKIRRAIGRAMELAEIHQQAESQFQDTLRRISMLGGAVVDHRGISELKERREQTAAQVNEVIAEIHGTGCQVKDLRMGLVDFPTLYHGDEVLLCWKYGEEGIHFWHGLEEGFQGRKPIDREFLDNHQGE